MARTKVIVRRQWRLSPCLLRKGTRQRTKRTYPYKIKLTLPKQKQVEIKKNGNVIKIINVRRKSKCFITRSARLF